MKVAIQRIIRYVNIQFFKKKLPNQIVVYFHDINSKELEVIKDIILFFKNLEYQFVPISEISRNFGSSKKQFTFTFDDGFKNWGYLLPIFKNNDIVATFFLNSIFLTDEKLDIFMNNIALNEKSKIIDRQGIIDIINDSHEIGAHTHSHFKLSSLDFETFKNEIEINMKHLKNFDIEITSFAIPYGMSRYTNKKQIDYLLDRFENVCFGEAGMLFNQDLNNIQRYPWQIDITFYENLVNLSTNTSIFNSLTKRSGLG